MNAITPGPAAPTLLPAELRRALLAWYDGARRDLPWRARPGTSADPYAVLVSEVMLQQTTVATVRPRYAAFLARFPDIRALASAPLDDVLHAWQGLGYYRRARALHACARAVVEQHAGRLPPSLDALHALPGIGAYTAAALAAIAFGLPAVPIDANVERVLGRLLALETPLPSGRSILDAAAARLASPERASDLAQAVMELGALVCTPRAPACLACPWRPWCRAAALGAPEAYPKRAARKERPVRFAVAFLLERPDGAILFRRRPLEGLLGGMAELPSTGWLDAPPSREVIDASAPAVAAWQELPSQATHGFTHFELRFTLLRARTDAGPPGLWVAPDAFGSLALPTMTLRLLRHAGFDVRRSGAPHVAQVHGPAPGAHGNGVEALGQAGELWPPLHEEEGGTGDPLLLLPAQGLESLAPGRTALDLDEHEQPTAAGNEVDLAHWAGEPPSQDVEALEPQKQRRGTLRPSSRPLAVVPAHSPRKARTRR
jgi:A/G-specific adenine glycosylase